MKKNKAKKDDTFWENHQITKEDYVLISKSLKW